MPHEFIDGAWQEPEEPQEERAPTTAIDLGAAPYFEGDKFIPSRLGEALQSAGHLRHGTDRSLWRYVDGVYRPDGAEWATETMRRVLGERWRSSYVDQVMRWLEGSRPEPVAEMGDLRYLNVKNGLLDWQTGELLPHTPKVVTTVQLQAEWHDDAEPMVAAKFLRDVLGEGMLPFAFEMLGYAIHPGGNSLRKAFLFYGSGANGKSKLLDLLGALVGRQNTSAVTLQQLTEDRFAKADLYGAQVNIAGDIDATPVKHPGIFKSLTGGDVVNAERKFRDSFRFVPRCVPFFSCNEYPPSFDTSQAWFDRWVVVPFTQRFDGDRADPDIISKITTPEELSGLLRMAVEGLRRLMDRGAFDPPSTVQAAMADYRRRIDTVSAFVEEECQLDPDAKTYRTDLHRRYTEYVEEQGQHPLAARRFYSKLESDYGLGQHPINGLDHFYGIKLATVVV